MYLRVVLAGGAIAAGGAVSAQTSPLTQREVAYTVDSGWVENDGDQRAVVFGTVVSDEQATWLRLRFDLAELGEPPPGGQPTELRMTSAWDGAVQTHEADTLSQWRNTSAYFNGPAVIVEIVADPGAGRSRLAMSSVWASDPVLGGITTICGPTDDRLPSEDARAARIVPQGCTVWLFDDAMHCFLSAGHCNVQGGNIVEFNVPDSLPNGDIQHPDPIDQYAVDALSVQDAFTGLGNDWAYFGCFTNTESGLTAFEQQGEFYELADDPPPVDGQTIRITGYGVDDSPPAWNLVQQTHIGPYVAMGGTVLGYEVDTRGGNSGSAVFDESTGLAIGIHTNGGCGVDEGNNTGTAVNNTQLQDALANPSGVCEPPTVVEFAFPNGLPELLSPTGGSVAVEIVGTDEGTPDPETAALAWSIDGGSPTMVPLVPVADDLYEAQFPPFDCGTVVSYHFGVETIEGDAVLEPTNAPNDAFEVLFAAGFDFVFDDDFEQNMGWSVTNSAGLTSGPWERGIPAGFGDRGDPAFDADGSSRCYVTGLPDGDNDIDGGSTTLTSPPLDTTQGDPHISYYRWFSNVEGAEPMQDIMVIEVSGNNGQSWVNLETIGPGGPQVEGGWYQRNFPVTNYVQPSTDFRIRFTASDAEPGSVVEAAVDAVRLSRSEEGYICGCTADVNGDAAVDVLDLSAVIAGWGGSGASDINGDGTTDVFDLMEVILNWGPC